MIYFKKISLRNFKIWIITWISLTLITLFSFGLNVFKNSIKSAEEKQIYAQISSKKDIINSLMTDIINDSNEILKSFSKKYAKEEHLIKNNQEEKTKLLKKYWNNSFLNNRSIEIALYSKDYEYKKINSSASKFSQDGILPKKIIDQHKHLTEGKHFFHCNLSCRFYFIKPLSKFGNRNEIIQLSIPIDEIIYRLSEKTHDVYFLITKKTAENKNNDHLTLGAYREIETSSDYAVEATFEKIIEDNNAKIFNNSTEIIASIEKSNYLLIFFDYQVVSLITLQNINSILTTSENAFNRLKKNSLLFLGIVISAVYLLFSKTIKRINWLNETLNLIKSKDFQSAREQLNQRKRPGIYDEIDEIYSSTASLTNELEQTLSILNSKNQQLTDSIKETRFIAEHDPLTGLVNRRKFTKLLEEAITKDQSFFLINFDLNHFKLINDFLGHAAGDDLLVKSSEIFADMINQTGIVGRMGGDEFSAIIFENNKSVIKNLLETLAARIKAIEIQNNHNNLHVSTSIGAAFFPDDSNSLEELSAFADLAMYENKRFKIDTYNFYNGTETIVQEEREAQFWRETIEWGLESKKLVPYVQAIVDVEHHNVFSFEALARIPEKSRKSGTFIEHAEKNHSIARIDMYMLECILQIGEKANLPRINVNLSYLTITNSNINEFIISMAMRYNYPPERIVFEITETIQIDNLLLVKSFVKKLKIHGFTFALDDFGSGFSSFSYLAKLGVDYIKIDKSIIRDLQNTNTASHSILKSIVTLAQELGIKTIAEGVENTTLVEILESHSIDYYQGFYFSKPFPMKQLKANTPQENLLAIREIALKSMDKSSILN